MPGPRTVAIVNPAAGGGRGLASWGAVAAGLHSLGESWDVLVSERPWHAALQARDAVDRGAERLVAVGGDGTVNEVVNGIARSRAGLPGAVLGIVPVGRGNDFVKPLGAPVGRPAESLERIRSREPHEVDVGKAGERLFVNGLGLGVDGYVVIATRGRRRFNGTLFYSVALARAVLSYKNAHARVVADGRALLDRPICIIAVTNGPCHGGGFWICPDAQVDDRRLDFVSADATGRLRVLGLAARVLRGAHVGHPSIVFSSASDVQIELDPPLPAQVDGELLGTAVHRIRASLAGRLAVVA
jgi:YegS/Rv2252/BmrU family lipid kinase